MLWLMQLVLPLALLFLLMFRPARHGMFFLIQISATASILIALHLAGLWITMPWWTPWVYWGMFALALWRACAMVNRAGAGAWGIAVILVCLPALGIGTWITVEALRAFTPPSPDMADISAPIGAGRFLVVNGGSREIMNAHLRTLPRRTSGQRSYWGQSYGVDLIAIDRWGRPVEGEVAVFAPCAGQVIRAVDSFTDGQPVRLASPTDRSGNHVLIRCARHDILMAHLRRASVKVSAGTDVKIGQALGIMGNSGASDMPHLHVHAQHPGSAEAPFSGAPVPLRIDGRFLVRGDRL